MPTPIAVALTFGRHSLAFGRAHAELRRLWAEVADYPEVRLKRDLWDGLLRQVYGDDVGSDALFLHTYLSILVKAIAARGEIGGKAAAEAGQRDCVAMSKMDRSSV